MSFSLRNITFLKEKTRAIILLYHRVADPICDPWDLSVSPEHFSDQMRWISTHMRPTPVGKLPDALQRGEENIVCVSFDDGYEDNLTMALPVLQEYGVPASFFICTSPILERKNFWWDDLASIFLEMDELPDTIGYSHAGVKKKFCLKGETSMTEAILQQHRYWKYHMSAPTSRARAFLETWQDLKKLSVSERDNCIQELAGQVGLGRHPAGSNARVLTEQQLLTLAKHPLAEIGAHSVTHRPMDGLSEAEQRDEIRESRQYLQDLTHQPVMNFAYPFGAFTGSTCRALHREGFRLGLTTAPTCVTKKNDRFMLGRVPVSNQTSGQLAMLIENTIKRSA